MARGGGLNLVSAGFSHLAEFGLSLVLARLLGASDLGVYWQSFALLSLLGLLSLSGIGAALTRFVAVYRAERDPGGVRGTVRLGLSVTVSVSVILGFCLFTISDWLASVAFDDSSLASPLRFVAATLPAVAFTNAALGATKGFKTMKPFAFIHLLLEPALRVALTISLLVLGMGLRGAMTALAVSYVVAAVAAAVALRRLMGRPVARATYRPRQLFSFSVLSWLASLASSGLLWADTILIGIFLSSRDVGIYNVATRLVLLASFVMLPINSSFAPRIADLYQRGWTETLSRAYAAATSWIVRLSLPGFIVIALFTSDLLRFFGPVFGVGVGVTVVLAAGKLIDAGTGPCAMMLNMSGRPVLNMADNIVVLVVNVVLNVVLIPIYGIVGSAIAWAISLALVNIARVLQVRMIMSMWPFGLGVVKGLLAGGASLAAGALVRVSAPDQVSFPAGLVTVTIVYCGLIVLFGLTDEDRLIFTMIKTRRGATDVGGSGG